MTHFETRNVSNKFKVEHTEPTIEDVLHEIWDEREAEEDLLS